MVRTNRHYAWWWTFIVDVVRSTEYPPVLRAVATYVVPLLAHLPLSLKRMVKTNFTSANHAASNVLKLVLDRDGAFSAAGGRAFAWGVEEVPLTADALNEEYCSELWKKSMEWVGVAEDDLRLLLNDSKVRPP